MPPRDFDAALVQALYRAFPYPGVPGVPDREVTYGPDFYLPEWWQTRANQLTTHGITNQSILVVGCAFGFLIAELQARGFTNVWGIDPGSYWWSPANANLWPTGVRTRVANDWVGSGTASSSLQALGAPARFRWIVDEDAITMAVDDVEIVQFLNSCETLLMGGALNRIIHLVSPDGPGDSAVNWKSMTAWKAYRPSHTWVDVRTGAIA